MWDGTPFVDKIEILKYFTRATCFPLLSSGELKLYILLLVSASGVDTIAKINLKQIEEANGTMPSQSELRAMMATLERFGLAILKDITGGATGVLSYRLKRLTKHRRRVR